MKLLLLLDSPLPHYLLMLGPKVNCFQISSNTFILHCEKLANSLMYRCDFPGMEFQLYTGGKSSDACGKWSQSWARSASWCTDVIF